MNSKSDLSANDYCCKYYPAIDRFYVSRSSPLNTLENVTESRFYKGLEYYRYIPGLDVRLKEIEKHVFTFPKECCFEITKSCNLDCHICIAKSTLKKAVMLSPRIIEEIVGNQRFARITISGGEPTLHPALVEIMDIASRNSETVILSTNGTNPKLLREIASLTTNIVLAVSLHGPQKVHDEFVGVRGSFSKVMECIHIAESYGLSLQIISVISKETIDSLEKLCRIIGNIDIAEHRLSLIKPQGRIRATRLSFNEAVSRIGSLVMPYKLSLKRRDQPFLFINALGKEEARNVRRY